MSSIPEEFHDLLTEKQAYAVFTTMGPDDMPHSTKVWVDYDEEKDRVLVNTERDRRKEKNVKNDPRVSILVPDPDNHYRWVSLTGEVDNITEEGAREHIDEMALKYTGEKEYQNPIETRRVILEIRPDSVITFNPMG